MRKQLQWSYYHGSSRDLTKFRQDVSIWMLHKTNSIKTSLMFLNVFLEDWWLRERRRPTLNLSSDSNYKIQFQASFMGGNLPFEAILSNKKRKGMVCFEPGVSDIRSLKCRYMEIFLHASGEVMTWSRQIVLKQRVSRQRLLKIIIYRYYHNSKSDDNVMIIFQLLTTFMTVLWNKFCLKTWYNMVKETCSVCAWVLYVNYFK